MGVYRFYTKHEVELEFLISVLAPIIKRDTTEVSLDWDRELNLWCITIRDIKEEGPF